MLLPAILAALIAPSQGGFLAHFALVILGFAAIAWIGTSRLARARKTTGTLPAIRAPVRDAASRQGLVHRGILTPERNERLRAMIGDVHTALTFSVQAGGDASNAMPDEFSGTFPDGSPFRFLLKKATIPLESVPEAHRKAGQPDADATATMLAMLVAFPQRRRAGLRLEILHRFMQVRFVRIATTLDTGSSAFNLRFFVAAPGACDVLPVFRIVTPALQTLLTSLFERFWLVNLIVGERTAFLSAVAFHPLTTRDHDAWTEAALEECIAAAARAKTYLD
ncbi:MAG: hypothetical protein DI629_13095 [Mesorhizobium amorphae]|nr:MAG: hypothetical protein DI629_13095 [Mesorhizobium amorphae]